MLELYAIDSSYKIFQNVGKFSNFSKKSSQLVVWFSWNLVASSHLLRNPIDDRRKGVSSQGQAPNCQKGLVQQLKDEMVGKMHGNLASDVQSVLKGFK